MRVSVLVCSHGADRWRDLAASRATPSADAQGAHEVVLAHYSVLTLAETRNEAAARATGDWLCFLDADDELCPGYIHAMHEAMRRWNLSRPGDLLYNPLLLAPAVQYCRAGVSQGAPGIPNLGGWPDSNECVIGTLVPRSLFADVGGFRELPSLEDWDLFLRCAVAGARIVHVPDAVYCAHVDPARPGRNSDQTVYDRIKADNIAAWG